MNRRKFIKSISACAAGMSLAGCGTSRGPESQRPNIILVMVDDMGYSDLGCYGGEIDTPHLDGMARNGIRFSQFYNCGRCCPTRASILTGQYSHAIRY